MITPIFMIDAQFSLIFVSAAIGSTNFLVGIQLTVFVKNNHVFSLTLTGVIFLQFNLIFHGV